MSFMSTIIHGTSQFWMSSGVAIFGSDSTRSWMLSRFVLKTFRCNTQPRKLSQRLRCQYRIRTFAISMATPVNPHAISSSDSPAQMATTKHIPGIKDAAKQKKPKAATASSYPLEVCRRRHGGCDYDPNSRNSFNHHQNTSTIVSRSSKS